MFNVKFKTYFCNFTSVRAKPRLKIKLQTYQHLKKKLGSPLLLLKKYKDASASASFPFFSVKNNLNTKLTVIAVKICKNTNLINFLNIKFNELIFLLINFGSDFLNFTLKWRRMEIKPSFNINERRYFLSKNINLPGPVNLNLKVTKVRGKNMFFSKLKIFAYFSKYFYYSKVFNAIFHKKSNNNLVNFLLNAKKRINLGKYQSMQDSAGYTAATFIFLNKLLSSKNISLPAKTAGYASELNQSENNNTGGRTSSWTALEELKNNKLFYEKKFIVFGSTTSISNFFFNPIVLKYVFIFFKDSLKNLFSAKFLFSSLSHHLCFFNEKIAVSNIFPTEKFSFFFKKYFLYITDFNKFDYRLLFPFQISIIKFIQSCSGKRVLFKIYAYMNNLLSAEEQIRCLLWSQKVKYYRRVLGPKLFLNESLQIIYLSLKNKDIHLFSNWATAMLYKISFWKHKTFLRYLKYVLRYFFLGIYRKIEFKGIKFQLKGKISVAGNSRTRTSYHYVGFTSHSTFNNKILHKLSLVKTFTGVLGFKIWFVF